MVKQELEEQGKKVVPYPCQKEVPAVVFFSSPYPGLATLQSYGRDPLPVWEHLTKSQLSHPTYNADEHLRIYIFQKNLKGWCKTLHVKFN